MTKVGMIGHVDPNKAALSAAITRVIAEGRGPYKPNWPVKGIGDGAFQVQTPDGKWVDVTAGSYAGALSKVQAQYEGGEASSAVHPDILDRYWNLLPADEEAECIPVPGTGNAHLKWMLQQIGEGMPSDKAMRWLGFIQGILIGRGTTTVQQERDFTRPYFTSGELP